MANEITNRESLAALVRWMNQQGWSPGTSTNYSFLHPELENVVVVSKSGVDKSEFSTEDFMQVDASGSPTNTYSEFKPSAETLIHTALYSMFPDTRFILHTHSKAATLLSHLNLNEGFIRFSGYEVLKGLPNIDTHDAMVDMPIFQNDQDMVRFSKMLLGKQNLLMNNAFLMDKHGLYVWGASLFEAKRHLEIYEFLLDIELTLKQIK
jgi:methylthioribulose-1-phosphate dehydratase